MDNLSLARVLSSSDDIVLHVSFSSDFLSKERSLKSERSRRRYYKNRPAEGAVVQRERSYQQALVVNLSLAIPMRVLLTDYGNLAKKETASVHSL